MGWEVEEWSVSYEIVGRGEGGTCGPRVGCRAIAKGREDPDGICARGRVDAGVDRWIGTTMREVLMQ